MQETTMETTTPETETSAPVAASEADAAAQSLPGFVGRLTPEEHQHLLKVRQESQQLMQKIGEHEILKMRIMQRLEVLEAEGQEVINSVSRRVGIPDGQQWVALADGTIRVINPAATTEGAAPS